MIRGKILNIIIDGVLNKLMPYSAAREIGHFTDNPSQNVVGIYDGVDLIIEK